MQVKLKPCSGCNELKRIWKREGRDGFCQTCWNRKAPKIISLPPPRIRIKPRSNKKLEEDLEYLLRRKDFLARPENNRCRGLLSWTGCTVTRYLTIQHLRGKVGDLYLDTRYWIPLCANCHRWVNDHPEQAEELGLAESRLNINPESINSVTINHNERNSGAYGQADTGTG